MKIIIKLLKITATINLVVIIPLAVITLITSKTNMIYGISSFVVLTGSMQPTIPTGSVIYTQRQSNYEKGDIVAFKSGEVNVTHRIIDVSNSNGIKTFTTKGDANNYADSQTISQSDIVGKQLIFIPFIGRAVTFMQTPFGFFYTVLFPIIVFVIMEFWNLKKEIEKEAEKKFRQKMKFASEHPWMHANKPTV